jgi:hypothetical protein
VVDERRRGDGRRSAEEREGGPDELAREPVRRERRGGHQDCVPDLRERVGARDVAEEPDGRLHDRGERRGEVDGLAAYDETFARGDALRQLRVEELVREDRRRYVAARLEGMVEGRDEEDGDEGDRGAVACARLRRLLRWCEHAACGRRRRPCSLQGRRARFHVVLYRLLSAKT